MSEKHQQLVPWPAPAVGEGFKASSAGELGLADVLAEPVGRGFRDLGTEGLDRLGVMASWLLDDPRILRLLPPEGQSFVAIESETAAPGAVEITDAGAAYGDLKRNQWLLLQLPSGTVRLEATAEGLLVVTERARIVPIAPLELSTPPLGQWCGPLGDTWLSEIVRERLSSPDDPWEVACAAGMAATLADLPNLRPSKTAGEALAAQRPLFELAQHLRRWTRSWSDTERATVRDLALVSVNQLEARLSDLVRHVNPDSAQSPVWMAELTYVCHLRHDLDGVQVLSEWSGADTLLAESLAEIDRRAEPFVQLLLLDEPVDDEWLRRVWRGQLDAWWGWPAALEEGE